jgi:glycosyltransferase involved in cell wall biosynthesis
MKILHVTPFVAPALGGSAIVPCQLSKELAIRGNEVTVVTTDFLFDEAHAKVQDEYALTVITFPCRFNFGSLILSPSMKSWLTLNTPDFDIVHMHNFRTYQNNIAHSCAKKHGVPYVLQAHGSVLPFFKKRLSKKAYDILWGKMILKDAAKILALTPGEVEQYEKMGVERERTAIVPNGIDASQYINLPNKSEFRTRYAIDSDEKIVLFLGRLHRIKGVDLLITAFAKVSEKMDRARLVIAGPDVGALTRLKKLTQELSLSDSVLFTGPLYDQDKLSAYVGADLFVLPSVYEMFPVTVLEACACGTPVIVSATCGIADLVKEFGCVVDRDADELCDAMYGILSDDAMRKTLGQRGRQFVTEELTWKKAVRQLERTYEDVLNSTARSVRCGRD